MAEISAPLPLREDCNISCSDTWKLVNSKLGPTFSPTLAVPEPTSNFLYGPVQHWASLAVSANFLLLKSASLDYMISTAWNSALVIINPCPISKLKLRASIYKFNKIFVSRFMSGFEWAILLLNQFIGFYLPNLHKFEIIQLVLFQTRMTLNTSSFQCRHREPRASANMYFGANPVPLLTLLLCAATTWNNIISSQFFWSSTIKYDNIYKGYGLICWPFHSSEGGRNLWISLRLLQFHTPLYLWYKSVPWSERKVCGHPRQVCNHL